MKITARPLTLGLALTLPLMGASALGTPSTTPDVVLASSSQPQSKPDPNGGHTGIHAKGCHGKFAQSRATASGFTRHYHYYPPQPFPPDYEKSTEIHVAHIGYYLLCNDDTERPQRIKFTGHRACVTQTDDHIDKLWYHGMYVPGVVIGKTGHRTVQFETIHVPRGDIRQGRTTCSRVYKVPADERHWQLRYEAHRRIKKHNLLLRWSARVDLRPAMKDPSLGAVAYWVNPRKDHRLG